MDKPTRLEVMLISGFVAFCVSLAIGLIFYDSIAQLINRLTLLVTIACVIGLMGLTALVTFELIMRFMERGELLRQLRLDTLKKRNDIELQLHDTNTGTFIIQNNTMVAYYPQPQHITGKADMPLLQGVDTLETNEDFLFDTLANDEELPTKHLWLVGGRNSGKSTLVNRLMSVEFSHFDITLIDVLFNLLDSNWLLPDTAKVSRDFVGTLTHFYNSHHDIVSRYDVSRRDVSPKLLVIDEVPTLLKDLQAKDKDTHGKVMAMLRAIYSQGSHTNHNLVLLGQTSLVKDIGLSNSDKSNFIQVYLAKQGKMYLDMKSDTRKKELTQRYAQLSALHKYLATIELDNGDVFIEPLPNLSAYGAKAKYGNKPTILALPIGDTANVANEATAKPIDEFSAKVIEAAKGMGDKIDLRKLWGMVHNGSYGGKQQARLERILSEAELI